MAAPIHVDIISPERPLYSGEATSVVAPAHDGEVGILTQHAAMVTKLGVGEVRIQRNTLGGPVTDRFAVNQGFLQTADSKVIIITEQAATPQDVDAKAVDTELNTVEQQLNGNPPKDEAEKLKSQRAWLKAKKNLAAHGK